MPRKTSTHPPTKWVAPVHPTNYLQYKFKLSSYRKGGAIRVTLAHDSPTAPDRVVIVPRSRIGYNEFVKAAISLLQCSVWDPTCDETKPAQARPMWNKRSPEYPMCQHNIQTIVLTLPRLLNPQPGRPLRPELDAARAALAANGNSTNATHITARARRGAEIQIAVDHALTAMTPIKEKMQDARRMKGYTAAEVNQLSGTVNEIVRGLEHLRRMLRTRTFWPEQKQMAIGRTRDELVTQGTPLSIDEEAFAEEMDRHETPQPSANLALPTEEEIADVQHRLAYAPTVEDMEQIKREWDARYPNHP